MPGGQAIALQAFTRVHLVPRVNGTAAAALVFERQGEEPLAMSLPLDVMGQVFGVLPQVMGLTAAGQEGATAPPLASAAWVPEALELEVQDAQARLVLRVGGVRVHVQPSAEQWQALAAQLSTHWAAGAPAAKPRARKDKSAPPTPEAAVDQPSTPKKRKPKRG